MNNGYIIPLFVAGTLLLTVFLFFLIAYLLIHKKKQNQYELEKQNLLFDAQRRILNARIEEQENTMNQISTELHDNISATLGLAQMNMYLIADISASTKQAELIDKTNNLLTTTIDDLHNISHSLNGNFVKNIGLIDVLKKDIDVFTSNSITCSLSITGEYYSFGSNKELLIYRIAQEAIHNAVKHAKATSVVTHLIYQPDFFEMSIADNGIGFEQNKINEMNGLGFFNMFQRANSLNGTLKVDSLISKGTKVTLTIDGRRNTDNTSDSG